MNTDSGSRPPLSVVFPAREGYGEVAEVVALALPLAQRVGAERIVVGDVAGAAVPDERIRLVQLASTDILALRRRGVEEAEGEVVAIGEDHAMPRPDWCDAVIRAHAEHPEADAVAGCLVNATDATLAGRANFLAFAAPWQPPMPALPPGRPPPSSALSFKREALEPIRTEATGWLEAGLIPSLFAAGKMAADERIVVDHHQDHGSFWSVRNAYDSARASYGYERGNLSPERRREVARWALANIPGRLRREARAGLQGEQMRASERLLVALIGLAAGIGAAAGLLRGPGVSGDRVA
jgi:hypothetical protein